MRALVIRLAAAGMCLVGLPSLVLAQGTIGGEVRDEGGGLLPGVTVEASSPALIEKVRTVVTDQSGRYTIVDLRPGAYVVTFSLTGFNTFRREGVVIVGASSVPVNAQLSIGTLEETVTVSGESPVVDVQTARQQLVLDNEFLQSIPRNQSGWATGMMLPGIVAGGTGNGGRDVGGSEGDQSMPNLAVHGSSGQDFSTTVEGLIQTDYSSAGSGERNVIILSPLATQEVQYETSGVSAEVQAGGVRMNYVAKDGGNTFQFSVLANGAPSAFVSDNLTDRLRSRGINSTDAIAKIWDANAAAGGPILRDKLWFFSSFRHWGVERLVADAYFESDPTQQANLLQRFSSVDVRATWQVTPRNKLVLWSNRQSRYIPRWNVSATRSPEASILQQYPSLFTQIGKWTAPINSRLLVEAGVSLSAITLEFARQPDTLGAIARQELTTGQFMGTATGVGGGGPMYDPTRSWATMASMSYVTGSHVLKIGMADSGGWKRTVMGQVPPLVRTVNGVPSDVQFFARPSVRHPRVNHELGLYVQDQWTFKRVTLNGGLRFDYVNAQIDAQDLSAGVPQYGGIFVQERHFDTIKNVPNWKDIVPRMSLAWDVFGTGKTAVKTSLSKYVQMVGQSFANTVNPAWATVALTDTRAVVATNNSADPYDWTFGPSTNLNWGLPVISPSPAEGLNEGWGKRGYNWEYTASVQQQVMPGLSAMLAYYHRSFGNIQWTNNTLVTPGDFSPLQIVNPIDGQPLTIYNLDPAKRGMRNDVQQIAPDNRNVFDGIDIIVGGRFLGKGTVNGGITMGRSRLTSCTVWDPNSLLHCDVNPPFTAQNQYKAVVSYPLPYGLHTSASIQSTPGPFIQALYTVNSTIAGTPLTNPTIAPTQPLGGSGVPLIEPGSMVGERLNQLALRFGKTVRVKESRLQGFVDIFNTFNADTILAYNNNYGANWQRPTATLVGRMVKLGVQFDF